MSGVIKKAAVLKAMGGVALAVLMTAASAFATEPGYRELDAAHTLVIDTTKGQVVVEMYEAMAPAHVERMTTLTRRGFYDGLIFHRVIEDFMDQTGDPKGTGEGGSDLPNLKGEFLTRKDASFPMTVVARPTGSLIGFVGAMPVQSQVSELAAITNDGKTNAWGLYCQGVLGMARDSAPDSANSQFFLMRGANSALEKRYTAFGVVVSGLDVVRKIKIGEPAVNPDKMLKVRVLADIPEADRPKIEVMDTTSPQFKQLIDQTRKSKGADFSACDIAVPTKRLDTPAVAATAAKPTSSTVTAPKPSPTAMPISPSILQTQKSTDK